MLNDMKKSGANNIAPKWALWTSFILFCLMGIGILFSFIVSLFLLPTEPTLALGEIVGTVITAYLIVYVPAKIIYQNYLINSK